MFLGDVQLALFQINFSNLNVMYVLFLKPLGNLPKKLNNWKSKIYLISLGLLYFHKNTASIIVQQNIQNTHTWLNKCT